MLVKQNEPYPQRLLSNTKKTNEVSKQVCSDCTMMHRALKGQELYTIGQVIDAEAINFERFCGLSVNALLCKIHPLHNDCSKDDTKLNIIGENKKELVYADFETDVQIPNIKEIEYSFENDANVIGFKKGAIEAISDNYPFANKGKYNDSDEPYQFKITVEYKPNPVNIFHFEVTLWGDHPIGKDTSGMLHKLNGKTSKKTYLNAIISKIKNRIIKNNFLFEVK